MVTTSVANERVKYARSLNRERVRTREKRFAIEGTRAVQEALQAGVRPVLAFFTPRLRSIPEGPRLLASLEQAAADLVEVTPQVMASMSETVTPQGVLAVVPVPELPWPEHGLIVILDSLRDPGNVGTMLRTAWAAGVAGVAASKGTADLYAPKVVRSAMGAHFHLPLRSGLDASALASLLDGRRAILAEREGEPYWQVDWRGDVALIVGGEARGAELVGELAQVRAAIPMTPGVESLNAAIAAAVLLFEAARQRRDDG